jgi:hypothetical protein
MRRERVKEEEEEEKLESEWPFQVNRGDSVRREGEKRRERENEGERKDLKAVHSVQVPLMNFFGGFVGHPIDVSVQTNVHSLPKMGKRDISVFPDSLHSSTRISYQQRFLIKKVSSSSRDKDERIKYEMIKREKKRRERERKKEREERGRQEP